MNYDDFTPDKYDYNRIESKLRHNSVTEVLDSILKWSDCSRIYKDGSRPMVTFHFAYKSNAWEYNYVLKYAEENGINVENYKNKFLELHERNLEFERINPPNLNYGKKKAKPKSRKAKTNDKPVKHTRRKDMFTGETIVEDITGAKDNLLSIDASKLVFNFNKK